MNVLMIRPDAVLVERDEIPIQKMFESLGIKCIKVLLWLFRFNYVLPRHRSATPILLVEDSTAGQLMFDEKVRKLKISKTKRFL